jgi:hypothetical protein
MTLPIDIFEVDGEGPRWLRSAASLEEARAHVRTIAGVPSAQYLFLNQATGEKVVLRAEGGQPATE